MLWCTSYASEYLEKEFKLDTESLSNFEEYLNAFLKEIISLKIWSKHIKEKKLLLYDQDQYLEEIISNLNQSLVLGAIGFRIPAYMMIRRSLENILSFIFYMEHPVEYMMKENESNKKNDYKISDYKEYLKSYPYHVKFGETQLESIKRLIQRITTAWTEQYRELSNFVHATNSDYLELGSYLENIVPSNDTLLSLHNQVQIFGTLVNALNIIFFNDIYIAMDKREKSFIRVSMSEEFEIKRGLTNSIGI